MGLEISRRDVIRQVQGLALATPFLSLIACDDGAARRSILITGATMGTTYAVKIAQTSGRVDRRRLENDIAAIFETVNAQMSTYRSESEVSRFNADTSESWVAISRDTLAVAEEALRVSRLTGGAFDPTIGPLVDLWGFGAGGGRQEVPSRDRINETLGSVGYGNLDTRTEPPSLRKDLSGTRIDLSGIAKGFGVDKVAAYLEEAGAVYYLVEVGGELRGRGYGPRGDVWRVGIERPVAAGRTVQRVVRLGGEALATSGDYRIFFEQEGSRYSHIIDTRNGRPVNHGLASVTVIASSTMQADALSTALMVLGAEEGMDLARRDGIAAFFIAKKENGFTETASPEFARYLVA